MPAPEKLRLTEAELAGAVGVPASFGLGTSRILKLATFAAADRALETVVADLREAAKNQVRHLSILGPHWAVHHALLEKAKEYESWIGGKR